MIFSNVSKHGRDVGMCVLKSKGAYTEDDQQYPAIQGRGCQIKWHFLFL
jgi:hypothetical protein